MFSVVLQQRRGRGEPEEQRSEERAGDAGLAERAAGGPGVGEDRPEQSGETEAGSERGAGGAEDGAGGHAGHHGRSAGAQVTLLYTFISEQRWHEYTHPLLK